MSDVGLLFVGAALFINGLALLGKIDMKSAGILNLFVGGLQLINPLYTIMTANNNMEIIFQAGGIPLYGFTFLFVGVCWVTNIDDSGLGWYSLWVSVMAAGYSITNIIKYTDPKFGIIWLTWSFISLLFFLIIVVKLPIEWFTGWVTIIISWLTATIPAFLILIGIWDLISDLAGVIIGIGLFLGFAILYRYQGSFKSKENEIGA